jgi:hypothetical protein
LVLSSRLQHQPLKEWAQMELDGYPANAELPSYRPLVTTQVLGDFSGPFGSGMKNHGLARSVVPEDWQEALFTAEIREGVAQIETLVASGESSFQIPWPMDVVASLQSDFMQGMNLLGARQIVPVTVFTSTLSGIRDRIVQFALEIEEVNPDAGEAAPGEQPIEPGRVTQIFNQTFHGDNTAVAAGERVTQTQNVSVAPEAMAELIEAFGIAARERDALLNALRTEGVFEGRPAGPETRRWVDRLESGAIAIGSGVTVQTAVAAISSMLGLT